MDRRAFLGALGLLAAPRVAVAQPARLRKVGVLAPGSASGSDQFQELVKAFRDGLRDLGWIEGQSVVIETRWGEGQVHKLQGIASELVARSMDVIVTWGPQAIRAAQQATATIPIVMAVVHEPVAFGFVKSLARPDGNITGLAFQDSELGTKRLELLKELLPRMRRAAFLWDPAGGGETGVRALKRLRASSAWRRKFSQSVGSRSSGPRSHPRGTTGRTQSYRSPLHFLRHTDKSSLSLPAPTVCR